MRSIASTPISELAFAGHSSTASAIGTTPITSDGGSDSDGTVSEHEGDGSSDTIVAQPTASAQLSTTAIPVNCVCRFPDEGDMICCDDCDGWFHLECARLDVGKVATISSYYCWKCRPALHTATSGRGNTSARLVGSGPLSTSEKRCLYLSIRHIKPGAGALPRGFWRSVHEYMASQFCIIRPEHALKNGWYRFGSFESGYDERSATHHPVGSRARKDLRRSVCSSPSAAAAGPSQPGGKRKRAAAPTREDVSARLARRLHWEELGNLRGRRRRSEAEVQPTVAEPEEREAEEEETEKDCVVSEDVFETIEAFVAETFEEMMARFDAEYEASCGAFLASKAQNDAVAVALFGEY